MLYNYHIIKSNIFANSSKLENKYEKNGQIRSESVRLIDSVGNNVGVTKTADALQMARDLEMDLVVISKGAENIPVAKIIDWAKFKYEQAKKRKNSKKNQALTKEWRFGANIEERDMQMKMEQVKKFIEKGGGKVKLTVRYVRRAQPYQLKETMDRILASSEEFSEKASEIQREGRNLAIYIKNKG